MTLGPLTAAPAAFQLSRPESRSRALEASLVPCRKATSRAAALRAGSATCWLWSFLG